MTTTTRRPPPKAPRKPPAKRTPTRRTPDKPAAAATTTPKAAPKTAPKAMPKGTAKAAPKTASKAAPKPVSKAVSKGTARRTAAHSPPRAPFVLLIVGLLGGALVSLLLLNTVLAEDAFTLTRLQQSNERLDQQRQALEEDIAHGDSPAELAKKAEAQNMRLPENPAFFYPGTGRASGGTVRPVPPEAAGAAGAAGVLGVPGTVVPGDGVPPAAAGQGTR
ncbi:YhcB family protein [Spirillospora sp. NBC_00431]